MKMQRIHSNYIPMKLYQLSSLLLLFLMIFNGCHNAGAAGEYQQILNGKTSQNHHQEDKLFKSEVVGELVSPESLAASTKTTIESLKLIDDDDDLLLPTDHETLLYPSSKLMNVHPQQILAEPQTLMALPSSAGSPVKGWKCHCLNSTNEFQDELECQCQGDSLLRIPQKLHKSTQRLIIESAGLPLLRRTGLKVYANSLRDITLRDLEHLESIQAGAFESIKYLRMIHIDNAPKLTYLSKDVFLNISSSLKTIRIINSGLVKIPDFKCLQSIGTILQMVDLEGNKIDRVYNKSVRIKTEQLILDNNAIKVIDSSAFYGSQIAKLSIKENRQLHEIHPTAFYGILNLQELDLSRTSLVVLPSVGLQELEVLRVQNTHTLKTIPSIYNFKNLQVAWLTHSFHCCAFKFPSRHDPSRHAKRIKYLENLQKTCSLNSGGDIQKKSNIIQKNLIGDDSEELNESYEEQHNRYLINHPANNVNFVIGNNKYREKRWMHELEQNPGNYIKRQFPHSSHFENGNSEQQEVETEKTHHHHHHQQNNNNHLDNNNNDNNMNASSDEYSSQSDEHPLRGSIVTIDNEETPELIKNDEQTFIENQLEEDQGLFHDSTVDVIGNNIYDAVCGKLTQKKIEVSCFPMPDALNPCEDVMGSNWLRASVWVVVLLAVFGNFSVLVVILTTRTDGSVPKFLMSHLAFADLCMGLYLLLIASIDAHSMGEYFNYAFDWQYGAGCKIAGFLTVFASHLSVFTLTIITLERWFAITHAIYLNKRIKLKPATYIMIGGWIYSFIMSALPLFGISNYSSTSICLPMEARDSLDVVYLVAILGINGAAFFIIAICYAQIYFSLGRETRRARNTTTGEMTVAKKMALLVFTNFSCWAPIAFFGLTALAGYPLIDVTKSKILLVFFYPLNSCADPYLYAILTAQYRRDLYTLLSKFGICKQKAMMYKGSISMPATNLTYNPPANGQPNLDKKPETETELMLNNGEYV